MLLFLSALGCLAIMFLAIILKKSYSYLPTRELQRKATAADPYATVFWRAVAYGESLQVLLWLVIGLSAAGGVILLSQVAPAFLGLMAVALLIWLAFAWLPNSKLTPFGVRLALWCTPAVVWVLRKVNAPLTRIADVFLRRYPADTHTGVYEREDLIDIIDRQKKQSDSRLKEAQLERLERALKFDDRKVRDIVVPRKTVVTINIDESIGPVLLDELHASKHNQFPVYEDKATNIVGTVLLRDLAAARAGGKVASHVAKQVFYIHEGDDLVSALEAFHATKASMLMVVNGFEEYIGILTLNDVLYELLGGVQESEFSMHEDKAAVAAKHSQINKAPDILTEDPSTPVLNGGELAPETIEADDK